jgi:tetratricopeptide (TPR) repeat protein
MSAKRFSKRPGGAKRPGGSKPRPAADRSLVGLRGVGNAFELVPPAAVRLRADDMEEVHKMLEMGEIDVAVDELRWLLHDCPGFIEAHKLLGEIALADNDLELAVQHFDYAYQVGIDALPKQRLKYPLSYGRAANKAFFEAGKGLASSLLKLGRRLQAVEVINRLVALDPSDPLALAAMLEGS